jgi:hypothetical protein
VSEFLYLDEAQTLRGAAELTAAGGAYFDERYSDGAAICHASEARPWGRDDIGSAFEKNYRPIEQQVMEAWFQLSVYVEKLGEAVVQTVEDLKGADQRSQTVIAKAYRQPR